MTEMNRDGIALWILLILLLMVPWIVL